MVGYEKQAVLSPTLVALETICELILPLLMAEIIDNGIANSNMPVILKMGALMLVVAGISMYCGVMASKHASFAAQGLGANLRPAEFERLSAFSFADIDRDYAAKEALPENQEFLRINQKATLAQIFTDLRYTRRDNEAMSAGLLHALREQGFLDATAGA